MNRPEVRARDGIAPSPHPLYRSHAVVDHSDLPMFAVFYNVRLALHVYFLLLIVHCLPSRVDEVEEVEPQRRWPGKRALQ